MLLNLFNALRAGGVPVSLRELLDLLDALQRQLVFADQEAFYFLARTLLVKDERHFDKFDRAFAAYFDGAAGGAAALAATIPEDWLRKEFDRLLSAEDRARLHGLGGLEQLLETFRQRLAEQQERHAGGSKWVGTGGSSPFGSGGYHPEGIRVGAAGERQGRAVKVWEERHYRNLDDQAALGSRNLQMALRRLRRFAREGAAEEFDLDGTVAHTARDGGLLNIRMRPQRRNAVKLLLLLDVGGSMDAHVQICEELFSACRSEFKHLEHFYFHNFVYESLWKDNQRRAGERIATWELLHRYGPDYKVVFVGDAAMGPYEITHTGGSVEHWNEEAGFVWMQRFMDSYRKLVWINPHGPQAWHYSQSTALVRELVAERMYPLTPGGLEQAMRYLAAN